MTLNGLVTSRHSKVDLCIQLHGHMTSHQHHNKVDLYMELHGHGQRKGLLESNGID